MGTQCRPKRVQMNLSIKTLAVTASHHDGALEYDMHNLYGMYECKSTAAALRTIRQKRHFILTRCALLPLLRTSMSAAQLYNSRF